MPNSAPRGPRVHALIAVATASLSLTAFVSTGSAQARDSRNFTHGRGTIEGGPRFASDNLDFGLGVDGGYTLPMGVYLGGLFDYYFAGDSGGQFGIGGFGAEVDWSVWFLMAEGGYDFGVANNFVLRPTFALGVSNVEVETCANVPGVAGGCTDASESDMEAALGGYALYNMSGLTLGGELRFIFGDIDGVWAGFNIGGVL